MRIKYIPFRPFGFDAISFYPWCFVWKGAKGDEGLIEHERVHLREQALSGTAAWWICYRVNKRFRLAEELEAYSHQIRIGAISLELAAEYLLGYGIDLTHDAAKELLEGALK